jgi:hypothetical protein
MFEVKKRHVRNLTLSRGRNFRASPEDSAVVTSRRGGKIPCHIAQQGQIKTQLKSIPSIALFQDYPGVILNYSRLDSCTYLATTFPTSFSTTWSCFQDYFRGRPAGNSSSEPISVVSGRVT